MFNFYIVKAPKGCYRELDGREWNCVNDETGCIYNDGHNGCDAPGNSKRPLYSKAKVDHSLGCKGHAIKKKTIGGYIWFCKSCFAASNKIKTSKEGE